MFEPSPQNIEDRRIQQMTSPEEFRRNRLMAFKEFEYVFEIRKPLSADEEQIAANEKQANVVFVETFERLSKDGLDPGMCKSLALKAAKDKLMEIKDILSPNLTEEPCMRKHNMSHANKELLSLKEALDMAPPGVLSTLVKNQCDESDAYVTTLKYHKSIGDDQDICNTMAEAAAKKVKERRLFNRIELEWFCLPVNPDIKSAFTYLR